MQRLSSHNILSISNKLEQHVHWFHNVWWFMCWNHFLGKPALRVLLWSYKHHKDPSEHINTWQMLEYADCWLTFNVTDDVSCGADAGGRYGDWESGVCGPCRDAILMKYTTHENSEYNDTFSHLHVHDVNIPWREQILFANNKLTIRKEGLSVETFECDSHLKPSNTESQVKHKNRFPDVKWHKHSSNSSIFTYHELCARGSAAPVTHFCVFVLHWLLVMMMMMMIYTHTHGERERKEERERDREATKQYVYGSNLHQAND